VKLPARRVVAVALVGSATLSANAIAQRRHGGHGIPIMPNTRYDGQFTFVRLRYGPEVGYASQGVPWSHDYPTGEENFMRIVGEISNLEPKLDETNILALDDPELCQYPIVYMAEPGFWSLDESEARAFRDYLLKGGFVIFDDFSESRGGWDPFARAFHRVLPGARFVDLDASQAIFHSFFEIDSLDIVPQAYDRGAPVFRGVFEDNDPSKRLLAIVNYNTDVSEYWEYSGTGVRPVDESNEAFKLGVNYVMYGMTH
jgi:hypothetical protein